MVDKGGKEKTFNNEKVAPGRGKVGDWDMKIFRWEGGGGTVPSEQSKPGGWEGG